MPRVIFNVNNVPIEGLENNNGMYLIPLHIDEAHKKTFRINSPVVINPTSDLTKGKHIGKITLRGPQTVRQTHIVTDDAVAPLGADYFSFQNTTHYLEFKFKAPHGPEFHTITFDVTLF